MSRLYALLKDLANGARGAHVQPVPHLPGCVSGCGSAFLWLARPEGCPFQVCTEVQFELRAPPARDCSPLTEILMILSNMTSGGTWKSKTKYWRGKDPDLLSLGGQGLNAGPSLLTVPVCTPAISLEPQSLDEQAGQPLVPPDPGGAGSRVVLSNTSSEPQLPELSDGGHDGPPQRLVMRLDETRVRYCKIRCGYMGPTDITIKPQCCLEDAPQVWRCLNVN